MALTLSPVAWGRAFAICALVDGEECPVLERLYRAEACGDSDAKAVFAQLERVAETGIPPNKTVFKLVSTHGRPKEIMEFKKGGIRILGFRAPHTPRSAVPVPVITLVGFCGKEDDNQQQSAAIERAEDRLAHCRTLPPLRIVDKEDRT